MKALKVHKLGTWLVKSWSMFIWGMFWVKMHQGEQKMLSQMLFSWMWRFLTSTMSNIKKIIHNILHIMVGQNVKKHLLKKPHI